jgi:hypothetical protein
MVGDCLDRDRRLPQPMRALLALWRRRCIGGTVPQESDLDAQVLQPWQSHLARIDLVASRGMTFRHCGTGLIRRLGRVATGVGVETLAGDIAAGLREALTRCIGLVAPVVAHPHVSLGNGFADHIDLVLPFADPTGRIAMLLLVSYEITGDGKGAVGKSPCKP